MDRNRVAEVQFVTELTAIPSSNFANYHSCINKFRAHYVSQVDLTVEKSRKKHLSPHLHHFIILNSTTSISNYKALIDIQYV